MTEVEALVPLGDGAIEAVARRVAQLLAPGATPDEGLLPASRVAARLGVDRSWVYAHADELGVVRLGDGPRPRLRFDPVVIAQRMLGRRAPTPAPTAPAGPAVPASRVRLLPIKPPVRSRPARTLE
jgi:hypothetical protein